MTRNERQKVAIEKWIKSGGRGTLQWCTGSGSLKWRTSLNYIFL